MAKPDKPVTLPVLMGVIGAPHGVRGEVRVKPYTDDPLALGDYGTLRDAQGRAFDVSDIRAQKNVVVVSFEQVRDRTAAEALNGVELFVARDQLPDAELEEDEFFVADLVGLAVTEDGAKTGEVVAVHNFGAGDLLEVRPATGGGTVLVPFTEQIVPDIDLEAGWMLMLPPEGIFGE